MRTRAWFVKHQRHHLAAKRGELTALMQGLTTGVGHGKNVVFQILSRKLADRQDVLAAEASQDVRAGEYQTFVVVVKMAMKTHVTSPRAVAVCETTKVPAHHTRKVIGVKRAKD